MIKCFKNSCLKEGIFKLKLSYSKKYISDINEMIFCLEHMNELTRWGKE